MRVFLDANVLFSAAKSDGPVRETLRLLAQEGHRCLVNAYVVGEARRNLAAKSPAAEAALDRMLESLGDTGASPGTESAELDPLPPKDRPVLAAAISARCDVLLTGDRAHFGRWFGKELAGVKIHSPRSMLETLLK